MPRPRTLRYGTGPSQEGDLHLPMRVRPPVICLLHGGFWRLPYARDQMVPLAEDLTRRGYAAWNLEYRRIGSPSGGWPATLQDAAAGFKNAIIAKDAPDAIAAVVSVIFFRIFQPYAFYGPGFFGLRPNPMWVANIKEQRAQAAGDIDFPPSLQWARRPVWFSAENMVDWGLGIPLGILALAGFLWAGWRMLKGDWQRHVLLWLWGGFYFVWQSLMFNPTMRYQMPTYPILAIYAAWAVVELWNFKRRNAEDAPAPGEENRYKPHRWVRLLAGALGGIVVVATFTWALAFSLIYARPITRVAASDWIYQNIPGPINLHIQTQGSLYNQLLAFPYGYTIQPGYPYETNFTANASGTLSEVYLPHVADTLASQPTDLSMSLTTSPDNAVPLATSIVTVTPSAASALSVGGTPLKFDTSVTLNAGQVYTLTLALTNASQVLDMCGSVGVALQTPAQLTTMTVPAPDPCVVTASSNLVLSFASQEGGVLTGQLTNMSNAPNPVAMLTS